MDQRVTIHKSTVQGLGDKCFVCIRQEEYDLSLDQRFLIPFTKNGKLGMMDKSGKVIVKPEFDIILDDCANKDSLIRVAKYYVVAFERKNRLPELYRRSEFGLMNSKGELVIPMDYESIAMPYQSLLYTVRKKDVGDYGVLNKNGEIVVEFGKYKRIDGFSKGFARVLSYDDRWGIIDELGNEVLPCGYGTIWNFYQKDYPTAIVETKEGQRRFHFASCALVKSLHDVHGGTNLKSLDIDDKDDYGTHYGEFAGNYAQDVMGYSDDVINDAFEGDPDAYWNID